ncbi:MAG: hypothetical protein JNM56_09225 [Planctomycetia bacterium]|nr:hypothetical protein [Planctomycetia bacterium]
MRRYLGLCLLLLLPTLACRRPVAEPQPPGGAAEAPAVSPEKVELAGLHNVLRVSDRLYSGSSPEGDTGFASLQKLGVKTVISVDGAKPDVERARQFGLRYVHLPIGYDGVPREQALKIARAVRDLPGPVYLHCHHGKHRAPAATAVVQLCLDDRCSIANALATMQTAGTSPHYTGLYAAPGEFRRPSKLELDRTPADFPEIAKVSGLIEVMIEIEHRWDHLKLVRAAGWKAPPTHPDIDPAHEALQLAEHYHEMARRPDVQDRPEDFRRWTTASEKGAKLLETALRVRPAPDAKQAELGYKQAATACTQCHAKYRDVPRKP